MAISSLNRRLCLAAAALLAALPAFAQPAPQRVMSLNMCSDQLVLALLPPERITSVTYLSHFSSDPALAAQAAAVGINYGLAEEVFAQDPDLVIAGDASTPATRAVLRRAGYPLHEIPSADTFAEIREQTRTLGRLLGETEKAESLVAEMDATLAELARTRPQRPIAVVAWDGSGLVPGRGTLFDEILTLAGGVNLAAAGSDAYSVGFDMERLLAAQPDLLAYGRFDPGTPSLQHALLVHPAIRKTYAGRQIVYPEHLYNCGVPASARAAKTLRDAMLGAMAGAGAR